jgi:MFS family permease
MVGHFTKRFSKLAIISTGLVIVGAGLALLGLSGQLYRSVNGVVLAHPYQIGILAAILVFLLGFVNAIVTVTAQTILQESTNDDNRGRVFGALNTMINLAATAPVLVVGVLADLVSVTKVIIAVGVVVFSFAMVQHGYVRRYKPHLRKRIGNAH